jgi:thiol-disulfide isomerase/thioredoxin
MINKLGAVVISICLLLVSPITLAAKPGDIAPECDAINKATLKNTNLSGMKAYRGKVIYLDFWATWCPPCRKSMPALNRLHNQLQSSGFEVVAINVDEHQSDAQQYLKQHPVDYSIIFDPTANCPKIYDLKGMPTSYLIDRNGVISDVHVGFRQGDIKKIRTKVQALLEANHD